MTQLEKKTKEELSFCPSCSVPVDVEDEFCPECNTTLKEKEVDGYKEGIC